MVEILSAEINGAFPMALALVGVLFTSVFPKIPSQRIKSFMLLVMGAVLMWTSVPMIQAAGVQAILISATILYTQNKFKGWRRNKQHPLT